MAASRISSLHSLIRRYQISLLAILAAAAGLGAVLAVFWQGGYEDALRLNGLLVEAQAVRGDLYRQIRSVDDRRASRPGDDYWQRLYRIDEHFYQMRQYANSSAERASIARMEAAYGLILAAMNRIVTRQQPAGAPPADIAARNTADFEAAYNDLAEQVAARRTALTRRLAFWTRLAPWLAWLPLALGLALALWLNRRFLRGFVQPLQALVAGTRRIGGGDSGHRLAVEGVVEVRELARTVNTMTAELQRSRRALAEREREAALGALVPVIAHNIRNPLAGIRANAQMLDARASTQEIEDTGRDIVDAADRLERWLDALLAYLHPLRLACASVALDAVVDGAVAALGGRVDAAGLRVERSRADQARVSADAALLEQALHGLLANALEASPRGAHLAVAIRVVDADVCLTIEDEGPGMARVPDPDTRTPGPTTKRRGTGLGIPFAYKVIHAHDGALTYERAPGGGTRAVVCLPASES